MIAASDLARQTYETIPLSSTYARTLGKPAYGSKIMVFGQPFNGKTVWLMQLANYLADHVGPVLYISPEEYGKGSLADKAAKFNIHSPQLIFSDSLPDILDTFRFIILDSATVMSLTLEGFRSLAQRYPDKTLIVVLQTTKAGTFRGGKDWEHEMDIVLEIYQHQPYILKNRYADEKVVISTDRKQVEREDRKYKDLLIRENKLLDSEKWLLKNPPPKEWTAGKYAWVLSQKET